MKYQKLINTNIKALRLANNLTQEEFAEKIGISIVGLSNIERNRYQPSSDTVDKICKTFDISPIELLTVAANNNEELIANISALLTQCSSLKLKKIYNIVNLSIKL